MKENKAKKKVSEKIAKAKAKIASKSIKLTASFAVAMLMFGCATSEPASRATTARYGDIIVRTDASTNVTVRITLGDGAIASADSTGSTETTNASPTNDVKPDINLKIPTGAASAVEAGAEAAKAAVECVGDACSE